MPNTREEFKQYCLRKIGAPVIQINLSDEQIEDRITESIAFFSDYHYNGSEHVYLKHVLTQEEIDQGYIETPKQLLGVTRIFDLNSSIGSGGGMFNITYQFVQNNMQDMTGYSIQNYYMTMQNLRFIQEWLVGWPMIRYNRLVNKLHLDMSKERLVAGRYLIIEAYDGVDQADGSDVWNDRWLQNYATALIKENWGNVLTKFTSAQLVGGMQFNGDQILNDAREERRSMEEDAISSLQPLNYNFSG